MEAVLVQILAPYLGALLSAGGEIAADATGRLATHTGKQAVAIWRKLFPTLRDRPAALEAAGDLASDPESPDAQAALRLQLKKLLQEDPSLASDLDRIVRSTSVTTGKGDVGFGDVRVSGQGTLVGRDVIGGIHTSQEYKSYVGDRVSGASGFPLLMITGGFLIAIVGFIVAIIGGIHAAQTPPEDAMAHATKVLLGVGAALFLLGGVIGQLGVIARRD